MLAGLQGVIVADEEEAHGGHQELKQLHQGGIPSIWAHLHNPHIDCHLTFSDWPPLEWQICDLLRSYMNAAKRTTVRIMWSWCMKA